MKAASGYASSAITLASFSGGANGAYPVSGIIADSAGNLFGTTRMGGSVGEGTVFEIVKTANGYAGAPTTLVSFDRPTSTREPFGGLVMDSAGNLFGTTTGGGGSVYEIMKTASGYASTSTILVTFNGANGAVPFASLTIDAA